jgi:hypothetical protein
MQPRALLPWPARSLALISLALPPLTAQNSMRKVRVPPSPTAARAGSAVEWRQDLDAALAEAKAKQKPVFWYVPTVAGSPMDRKPEIDRYMLAGPFSWPSTIALLNQHFVPVKAIAKGELQTRLRMKRHQFLEPGWVLLDGAGKELARLDQITTFHPQWFEAPLRRLAQQPDTGLGAAPALREAWNAYQAGDLEGTGKACSAVLAQQPSDAVVAEARFLAGAALCRSGAASAARAAWQALADLLPEQPLAWKAAMEAEGHGPFVHGFEDFLPLPERVLRERDEGSRAPRGTYVEPELWLRSTQFLLRMVEDDGLVRDSIYDFGGTDSLPNVYVAVTCLVGEALLHAAERARAGAFPADAALRARIESTLQKLLLVQGDDTKLALQDKDEILWAHAYRIRFLARWQAMRSADRGKVVPRMQAAVDALQALQPDDGFWFHEYGNPFAVATALLALADARDAGGVVDQERVAKGLRALQSARAKNGAFTYGNPGGREPRSSIETAAGRMPLCELALLRWQKSTPASLQAALAAGFEHHGHLAAARKYDDHANLGYGGFFFWYDMLGRAEAVMAVEDAPQRGLWQAQQKKLVLDLPEFDGCFVDSHELGRAYGTAMALLCLATLAR